MPRFIPVDPFDRAVKQLHEHFRLLLGPEKVPVRKRRS
jgi:hypothetical protein